MADEKQNEPDPRREALYGIVFWCAVPLVIVGIVYALQAVGIHF